MNRKKDEKHMNSQPRAPQELQSICDRWSESLKELSGLESRVSYITQNLPELLLNKALFAGILKNVAAGAGYPDIKQSTMFDNEVLLVADPRRMFSIRLYLWSPGEYTPVHDHNAWGVIGPVSGEFEVMRFCRKDDGSREDYAQLEETERLMLSPGQTEMTMPLDDGIHKTGIPTGITTATIHLYGNPVRRSYINLFYLGSGNVYRMYAPKARKRMLASEALRGLQ